MDGFALLIKVSLIPVHALGKQNEIETLSVLTSFLSLLGPLMQP